MSPPNVSVEEVLESRYEQLLNWGRLLTRGDAGMAQEIVHDLCVYLALTEPDFGTIANLDGYLYTSLRHTYLSRIERSAREATCVVSVEDYDSIHFALAAQTSGMTLEVQNDLRQICGYSVWRKDFSKSFSYFILHFFHGYFPREIAEIACLPIPAIYNKLKVARTELRDYLANPKVVPISGREAPPAPAHSRTTASSMELFRELRETILRARRAKCLPEEEVLSHYRAARPSPISVIRLAQLPVGPPPPEGTHTLTHHTSLSDGRWLELTIVFDGLGMESEVTYSDPAVAIAIEDDTEEEALCQSIVNMMEYRHDISIVSSKTRSSAHE